MAKRFLFSLSLMFLLIFSASAEKYGLIIAVGDYPAEGRWPAISSKNDVLHIEGALVHLGFDKSNIARIFDEEATKSGIINAIKNLTGKLKPGDIVYIHFSGHGQQVMDDNNDELDRLDEAIVPYDSPMIFEQGVYEGENLIRDDLIGELTEAIRLKIGPDGQLILVMDSCHSGTGTRGMGKTRGTDKLMAPDDFRINTLTNEKASSLSTGKTDMMAPMASFFGASPRELNYETLDEHARPVGSLSYAVAEVLSEMKNEYSFSDFFERIKLKMKVFAPRQNPQWEGPELVKILGGEVPGRNQNFKIEEYISSTEIKVAMGTLSDVYNGSEVEVINVDNAEVVTRGVVSSANIASSMVTLENPINTDGSVLHEIKVVERAFPQFRANINVQLPDNSNWTKLTEDVKAIPVFNEVEANADIFITECGEDNAIQLATKDGSVLYTASFNPNRLRKINNEIKTTIRSFVQGKFLRSYENPLSNFDFSLEIEEIDCETGVTTKALKSSEISLKVGTCVRFVVKNNGVVGAYFSIIDIQPDNIINLVTPAIDLGYTADEYYLKPGGTYATNYPIEIAQPSGEETLKVISSKNPLDLAGIIRTQGKSTRGVQNLDPFEAFMASSYQTNTRGAKIKKQSGEEVGTKTLFFNIVE